MKNANDQLLVKAIYKVLRPLVRLLMRHGVTYRSFADIARHLYVDVAEEDFALENRKVSNARTAILTGINRKDIAKLKARPHPLEQMQSDAPSSLSRVINAWLSDERCQSASGPKELSIEECDGEYSFTDLVKEYTTDITVRALLDELRRIKACSTSGDKVCLLVSAYVPIEDMQETLRIFSTAASDLLSTMDHNIAKLPSGPFIQRTVSYNNIPEELLEQIRQRCTSEGDTFLLQVNEWLSKQDRDQNNTLSGTGRYRAGIGIYYLEHPETENCEDDND